MGPLRRMLVVAGVVGVGVLGNATNVSAATRYVDDDRAECSGARYTTIQAAVDAAAPYDTVIVCPGGYAEHVTITKAGLQLRAVPRLGASLQSNRRPLASGAAQVQDATIEIRAIGVGVDGFHIFAPPSESGDCVQDPLQALIWVRTGTGVRIANNILTQMDEQNCGASAGNAQVVVGADGQTTPVGATVENNQLLSIGGFNCACGGVEAHSGYTAVLNNVITGQAYTGFRGLGGRGVSFRSSSGPAPRGEVRSNDISRFETEGISLDGRGQQTRFTVIGNRVHDNGIGIIAFGMNDTISRNTVRGNNAGISYSGNNSLIEANQSRDNLGNGIEIPGDVPAAGNRLLNNTSLGNRLDCRDGTHGSDPRTGTANEWSGNIGRTDDPPTLCRAP